MTNANMPPEAQKMLMQMQVDQQNLQQVQYQKEMLKEQKSQVDYALTSMGKSSGEVFKIAGPIIIKSDRDEIQKELEDQKEMIDVNLKKIESQEKETKERLEKNQKEIQNLLQQQGSQDAE